MTGVFSGKTSLFCLQFVPVRQRELWQSLGTSAGGAGGDLHRSRLILLSLVHIRHVTINLIVLICLSDQQGALSAVGGG